MSKKIVLSLIALAAVFGISAGPASADPGTGTGTTTTSTTTPPVQKDGLWWP